MSRILLILLVALLPLQWSGALAAVRCLHDGPGPGHATSAGASQDGAARAHAAHHEHASHDHASSHDHGSHGGDTATSAEGTLADLVDCGHADCGGCCHGGGTLPAAAHRLLAAPAFGAPPRARVDASPASPALDGPFRPPRVRSA
ncbi:MAG: hypothetical protein O9345_14415 [Burkholderiaceae bacterium]|nr:hypothetical protein [Burkholderiales bacterium]MCZ8098044.1 hypothetical protein [Burkholderiales bacterium]MCZ8339317.1 hypothetical protein [Burkholderiaceae bacterium]